MATGVEGAEIERDGLPTGIDVVVRGVTALELVDIVVPVLAHQVAIDRCQNLAIFARFEIVLEHRPITEGDFDLARLGQSEVPLVTP